MDPEPGRIVCVEMLLNEFDESYLAGELFYKKKTGIRGKIATFKI
jgi:hypothetical protein